MTKNPRGRYWYLFFKLKSAEGFATMSQCDSAQYAWSRTACCGICQKTRLSGYH